MTNLCTAARYPRVPNWIDQGQAVASFIKTLLLPLNRFGDKYGKAMLGNAAERLPRTLKLIEFGDERENFLCNVTVSSKQRTKSLYAYPR